MSTKRHLRAYPPEFRRKLTDLIRAGRRIDELALEFNVSGQTLRNWIKQGDLDAGRRVHGPTSAELEEISRLRKRVKQLEIEREIVSSFERSGQAYGRPRIQADLREARIHTSDKRVARLMRVRRLRGACRRKLVCTTIRDEACTVAEDLVNRRFVADAPDRLWVADITCVPTQAGFLYLAVVLDVFSRMVVGWAMDRRMPAALVVNAVNMAARWRRTKGVIHHSDHGSQYTSVSFTERCKSLGVTVSMGSVGDCYDNAMCESFNATLECELLAFHRFRDHRVAANVVFDFIQGFYNPRRRHTALGGISPMEFERRHSMKRVA